MISLASHRTPATRVVKKKLTGGHTDFVTCVGFSTHDPNVLASCSTDKSVRALRPPPPHTHSLSPYLQIYFFLTCGSPQTSSVLFFVAIWFDFLV